MHAKDLPDKDNSKIFHLANFCLGCMEDLYYYDLFIDTLNKRSLYKPKLIFSGNFSE